jgi:hypothetical protein
MEGSLLHSIISSTYPRTHFPVEAMAPVQPVRLSHVTDLLPQGNLVKSWHRALSKRKTVCLCLTGLINPYANGVRHKRYELAKKATLRAPSRW